MTEIEHFIELCKNNQLKEAKEYFFKNNIEINDEILDDIHIHKCLVEFANNNQYEILNFLFEVELANEYKCFKNCCKFEDAKLAKYILQMPYFYIWDSIMDIFISCQLETAKNLLKIIPEIDICKNNDIIFAFSLHL